VLKKRELEEAAVKISWEERDAMRQKWDMMGAEEMEGELAMDAEEAITLLKGNYKPKQKRQQRERQELFKDLLDVNILVNCPLTIDIHSLHHQYCMCNIFCCLLVSYLLVLWRE